MASGNQAPASPDIIRRLPDQLKMLDLQLRAGLEQQKMPKSIAKWEEFLIAVIEEWEENARRVQQSNGQ